MTTFQQRSQNVLNVTLEKRFKRSRICLNIVSESSDEITNTDEDMRVKSK